MSVVQYEKHKCDNCGKEVETKGNYRPRGWYEININKWSFNRGDILLDKEVCSEKCVLELLHKIEKVPKPKPTKMICY